MRSDVSVVIPLYNKEATIARAIDSVMSQGSAAKHVWIVDDGSCDGSAAVVNERIEHYRQQGALTEITLISQQNQGVSVARNTGIAHVRSEFTALLDADDTYEPDFISEIECLISEYAHANVFVSAYQFCLPDHSTQVASWAKSKRLAPRGILQDYFALAASGDLPLSASSVCVRTQALRQVGGFPPGQQMGEDQWVWSLLALGNDIAYSTRVLSNYHLAVADSLMGTIVPSEELPYSAMLQDLLDHRYKGESVAASLGAYIRTHLYDLVRRNCQAGQRQVAAKLLADQRLHWWRLRSIVWYGRLMVSKQRHV